MTRRRSRWALILIPFLAVMTFVVSGAQAVSLPAQVDLRSVSPQTFSPDGDGAEDTTSLYFCLSASANVTAVVSHGGSPVRVLASGKSYPGGCNWLEWDGTADDGSPAPEGTYQVQLQAVNDSAQTTTASAEVDLLRRVPGAVTSPAPDATLAGTATFAFTPASGFDVESVQFTLSGTAGSCYVPSVDAADADGVFRTSWDTAKECGDGARTLTASVSWIDRFGSRHWWTSPAANVRLDNPAAPVLSVQGSGAQVFSPNGDMQEDTYEFRWCAVDDIDGGSVSTTVRIRDASGAVVRTLFEQLATPSAYCQLYWGGGTWASWDGLADDGTVVPDGDYVIEAAGTDATGLTGTTTSPVVVDHRVPGVLSAPADGGTVADTASFVFTPTAGVAVESVQFSMYGSQVSCFSPPVTQPDADGLFQVSWDTAADCGDGARSLTASVAWLDRFGYRHWWTSPVAQVRLDNPAAPVVSVQGSGAPVFSPNSDRQEDEYAFRWCAVDDVDGGSLATSVRIRAADGAVVRTLVDEATTPSGYCQLYWGGGTWATWDGLADDGTPAADGDYVIDVSATDATGLTSTTSTPVVIDRRPPVVLTAPADGATLAGTTTFAVRPTEGISVTSVQFSLANAQVNCSSPAVTAPDADGLFQLSWDTATNCGDGPRWLNTSVSWVDRLGGQHWWTAPARPVLLDNPAAPAVAVLGNGPQVFSPDGDGQEDGHDFRWCAADSVDGGQLDTAVRVLDGSGAVVRTLVEQVADPSASCQLYWGGGTWATWDGLTDDGTAAPDGDYSIQVVSTDATGLTGTVTTPVTVDRRLPGVLTSPAPGSTVAGTAPFVFTPTDGFTINQVAYGLAGIGFSTYNASPDGTWRTTQAVGALPAGAADLSWTVYWTDRLGGSHQTSRTVQVAVDPTAIPLVIDQDVTTGTAPFTARLTVHASDPNGASLRVDVDWGDGATQRLDLASPYDPLPLTHDYAKPGTYRAFLSVSNGTGGYASQSVPIAAGGKPNAAPQVTVGTTPATGVAPLDTVTTLAATDADGDPLTYRVDFGDGSPVATGLLPREGLAHRYTGAGTYLLRTEITDGQLAVVRYSRVVVGLSEPLRAEAGDALSGVVGTAVHLDGGTSAPAAGITSYTWDPGDGTGTTTGSGLDHTYARAGSYTATLTVGSGAATATDTTTVTVTAPPASRGLTVSVTGNGSPLGGAQLTVIAPDGRRITGTTDGSGNGLLPDLADGSVTAYVLAPGYRPAVATGTVTDGHGSATVDLSPGEVGAATLEQHRMDLAQIEAAGISVADPANTHVYEAEVHLFFEPVTPTPDDTVHIYITPTQVLCASNCEPPAEAPGCSPTGDNPCYYLPATSDSGGGGGGYTIYPQVIYVADQPIIQWLVLPVRASFLKEFFQAQMVVQNLTTGFTFTNGSASLELPSGLSLAPTSAAQSLTPTVPDVPGGESRTVTWTIRGDVEGEYGLAADYVGSLQPIDQPVRLRAVATNPLKVWGASALKTTIIVDDYATRWAPYQVDVEIRNVSDTPVYNLQFEMFDRPADAPDNQAPYVFAPAYEGRVYQDAVLEAKDCTTSPDCASMTATYVVYPGLGNDEVTDLQVVTGRSFAQRTGGDVDLAPTIQERCGCTFEVWRQQHPEPGQVTVDIEKGADGQDVAHVGWGPSPRASDSTAPIAYTLWTRQSVEGPASTRDRWRYYGAGMPRGDGATIDIPSSVRAIGRYYAIGTLYPDHHVEWHHILGTGPARYVALGDSYSSGEGVPEFEPGTDADLTLNPLDKNTCHRSVQGSYSRLLAATPPTGVALNPAVFAACSGAVTADVLGPNREKGEAAQIDHVSRFTDVITLSMGGNDIGFSDIATLCIAADCTLDLALDRAFGNDTWLSALDGAWAESGPLRELLTTCLNPTSPLQKLLCAQKAARMAQNSVDEVVSGIGRSTSGAYLHSGELVRRLTRVYTQLALDAPNATIMVLPYPPILDDEQFPAHCTLTRSGTWLGLSTNERQALRQVLDKLNKGIEEAKQKANTYLQTVLGHPSVQVVQLDQASYAGHALCGENGLNYATHFNPLVDPFGLSGNAGPTMYSVHPNADGQTDYFTSIRKAFEPEVGPSPVLVHPETLTQAGTVVVQGSSPVLQGSSSTLQASSGNPQDGATLVAQLSWPGSTATLHLTAPDGSTVDANTPGVMAQTTPTSQTLTIPNAQVGKWSVAVYGDDVDPAGEPATVRAYAVSDVPEPPVVDVRGTRIAETESDFTLSGLSNAPAGSTYTWYFSDDTTAGGATVRHLFAPEATTWWATLEVRTPDGRSGWASVELGGPPTAPVITSPGPPVGTIGTQFSMPLTATGRPAPRFELASGELPPGLTLDPVTGLVSGAPTTGGTWTVTVSATNSVGTATTDPITIAVQYPPLFTAAAPPASLTAGQQMSYAFGGSGVPAPSFAATGTLPPGLTLGADGLLSGTPTTTGEFTFSVTAGNAAGTATAGPFTVTVVDGTPGAPSGVTATAADGAATVTWQPPAGTGGSALTGYVVTAQPGGGTCTSAATSCTVTGLTNGTAYTFTVVAANAGGRTSPPSLASAAVVPAGPPGAPTAVVATPGDGSAGVSWTPPAANGGSPLTGYTVTASPGTATCRTTATGCTLPGLANGTSYSVLVAAETAAGSTPAAAVTVVPAGPPSPPTGVTAAAADRAATVSWTAPATANGSPITGYTVTAQPGGASCTSDTTSCTVTGLTNGTAYTFVVVAANGAGSSVPSAASAAVVPVGAPGAPGAVTVDPGDRQITVAWQAPASTGGAPITRYVVVADPGGATCTTPGTTCVLTGLTNGTAYTVTVRAENGAGLVGTSAPTAPVTPVGAPATPTGARGVAGDGTATVSWVAATGADSYVVTASPGGATCRVTAATSCTVPGLTNGTSYGFTIVAVGTSGLTSAASAPTAAVVPVGAPSTPRAVTVKAGDRQLAVSWQAPASTGGAPITRYVVVASPGGATCTSSGTSCVLTGLSNGTAYTVAVRAENGAGLSGTSAPTAPVTPMGTPATPTGARAVAGDGKATVSWVPGKNGAGAAVGYVVTASPGGATCRVSGGTSCTVPGLTNGTSYRFTVVAVGATGLTSVASTRTAAVVPIGAPSAPRAVTVKAGDRQLTVSWQAPAATGGSPLAKYTVTATPVAGVRGVVARSCTTTSRSCAVTGLVNGVDYRVQVVTANTAGKVSAPAQAATTVRPFGRPGAPQRVTVTPGRGSLTVSWQPANGNGSAVVRYTVTTSPGRGSCTAQGTTSCTIRGLDPKTAYRVQVTATNAAGLVSATGSAGSAVRPKA